jgi:hypothetical protein
MQHQSVKYINNNERPAMNDIFMIDRLAKKR